MAAGHWPPGDRGSRAAPWGRRRPARGAKHAPFVARKQTGNDRCLPSIPREQRRSRARPQEGKPHHMTMNRRDLLRFGGGAVLLGGAAPALLAACGSDSKSSSTTAAKATTTAAGATPGGSTAPAGSGPAADLGTLNYQLSWIKNVEFAGAYIADTKGYYKAAGFSAVNLIAGGPVGQPAEVVVAAGKALVGISSPDITAAAITKGAQLVIIGAQYQKNPFAIMSPGPAPIKTPEDMFGKKIGRPGDQRAGLGRVPEGQPASTTARSPRYRRSSTRRRWSPSDVDGWFSLHHQRAEPAQDPGRRHVGDAAQRPRLPDGLRGLRGQHGLADRAARPAQGDS